jgi:signal transduction histidine kinase/ActR/RegA family two-component response regulator
VQANGAVVSDKGRSVRSRLPLVAGVFLVLFAVTTSWLIYESRRRDQLVERTLEVESTLSELTRTVLGAESQARGYVATSDKNFLGNFNAAPVDLSAGLAHLRGSVADNPAELALADHVALAGLGRLDQLRKVVARKAAGQDRAAVDGLESATGLQQFRAFRDQTTLMRQEETRLLLDRTRSAAKTRLALGLASGLAGLSAIVFTLLWAYNARRSALALRRAYSDLNIANRQLQEEAANRETAEAQLRQLQKMEAIGQLTGGIAHDFNNMLAVIIGNLNLIERRIAKGQTDIGSYVASALVGASRAATLTGRLLAFSRQQPLAPQPVDLNRLMLNVSELLRRTLGETIRIETVLGAGLWRTKVDPAQLENAILNLAVNSRDAMGGSGKLTIETANSFLDESYAVVGAVEPGQYVMIAVTDSGMGMSPEVAERAFEPFFTTKATGKGTGLGLSQVYGFVKQTHGHVKIYSEIGQGTTVKIYLPRLFDESVEADQDRRPAIGDVTGTAAEVVLVVEDEDRVRQFAVEALRELGYTVLHADGAAEAMAKLKAAPEVSLLLTDIVMPDRSGRELAEDAVRLKPNLSVLYMTGFSRNAVVHNGTLDPGVNFLAKPFTLDQLGAKVREVLNAAERVES